MDSECPFCRETGRLQDEPLFAGTTFYVLGMMDPARQHAVMIVPHRHVETPFDLTTKEWAGLPEALAFAQDHLRSFGAPGYTIGWNVGAVAGQHVRHAHMHVICRFDGEPSSGKGLNALITSVSEAP